MQKIFLTTNDILNIQLRNKDNPDVERLIWAYQDARAEIDNKPAICPHCCEGL